MNRAGLERSNTDSDLESGARRISGTKSARQKWKVGIVLQLFEFFRRNRRDKEIRIESRPRRHRQNVAVGWVDNDNRTALGFGRERFLGQLLKAQIQCSYDVVTRDCRLDQSL